MKGRISEKVVQVYAIGIQKNNAERFAVEKPNIGTKVCDCQGTIDFEAIHFLILSIVFA
jgi:hypothetical protein